MKPCCIKLDVLKTRCQDRIKSPKNVLDLLIQVAKFFSLLPGSCAKFFPCVPAQAGTEYPDVIYIQRKQWHPTPVLLPGKSHGQRSLVGCSPWGHYESDMIERLHFHFSLSCIGEGKGNPLQWSCLENPGMGEPGGLPSMRSHRVGHDWSDLAGAMLYTRASLMAQW